ncbi:MAG: hypothetical protein ACRDPD_12915 [Streptosporangiaceae bacterium]
MVAGWRRARAAFFTGSPWRRQGDGRLVPVRSDTILRTGDEAVVLSTDPDAAGLTALFAAPVRD